MIPVTTENIKLARQFLFEKWKERAVEKGYEVSDLSNACKFASLFAQKLFGGKLQGNWNHQFVVSDSGQIIDLTDGAGLSVNDPYKHDRSFWGNIEHRKSLQSCDPRVEKWVAEFMQKKENFSFRDYLKISEDGTSTACVAGFVRPIMGQPFVRQGVWSEEDPFFKRRKKIKTSVAILPK